jgi:uncharacterized membrane protein
VLVASAWDGCMGPFCARSLFRAVACSSFSAGRSVCLTPTRIAAAAYGIALPDQYRRYSWYWFVLGWPILLGVLAIFWLMAAKPQLW